MAAFGYLPLTVENAAGDYPLSGLWNLRWNSEKCPCVYPHESKHLDRNAMLSLPLIEFHGVTYTFGHVLQLGISESGSWQNL